MHTLLGTLAVLVLAALATWAHLAFWRRRLALTGGASERLTARTADGWDLALARRRPAPGAPPRPCPVLLVHGIAMNRHALDFGGPPTSLAAALAEAGFDCFALDLRGHGDARPGPGAPRDWSLDEYLDQDVPAALDAVRAATGAARVLWVGHSQGALLGLAAAALLPGRIAGLVALAPPIRLDGAVPLVRRIPLLARLGLTRFLARVVAPWAGWWQPPAANAALQLAEMERPTCRRMLMHAIEDLPRGVVAQFEDFVRRDRFGSRDGARDYRALLAACRQPALFVAAPEDGLAPPRVVEEAFDRWGGEKALSVAPAGVGHTDLILGRRAPSWTFPAVRAWLEAHAGAGPAGEVPARAGLAHELRAPLGAVALLAEAAADAAAGTPAAPHLARLRAEVAALGETVEELLDEARAASPRRAPVALAPLLEEVAALVAPQAAARGLEVRVAGGGEARADRVQLRRALLNLARNAVEASPDNGVVELTAAREGAAAALTVADRGPGLDEAARARLFEPFVTGKPHGTGLGLALARRVAEAHGGALALLPREGGGTEARLTVPDA